MTTPWTIQQIEPEVWAIVDADGETILTLDGWEYAEGEMVVEMVNGLVEALEAVWNDRGENIMGESLCPLHGPDCGADCIIPTALARVRGEGENDG